jgi:multidrug efflux pump subunit AcrA (membrane-fusion protein)
VRTAVWDRVEAGAVLFELDDRELRATLRTQQAQVAVAEAQILQPIQTRAMAVLVVQDLSL